jgi:group I intron endonuclease
MLAIYSIVNKENGSVYIGSTTNFERRKSEHLSMIKSGYHQNKKINLELKSFNPDSFSIEILSSFDSISVKWLRYLEATWIEYISNHFKVYNINYNTISFGRFSYSYDNRDEKLAFRKVRKLEISKINKLVNLKLESEGIFNLTKLSQEDNEYF